MSACTEIAPLVAFRALGVLEPAEASLLEEHLAACATCPDEARALEGALEVVRPVPAAAPGGGWEKIAAAIGEGVRTAVPVAIACTYCKGSLGGGERVHCASCLAPYHVDCWREHGRCAVAGCGELEVVKAGRLDARTGPPRRVSGPWTAVALFVAGGLGVAALGLSNLLRPIEPPKVAETTVATPAPEAAGVASAAAPPSGLGPEPARADDADVENYPSDHDPIYAVIGSRGARGFAETARFALRVRKKLVELLESAARREIEWPPNPCHACKGVAVDAGKPCPRCGGTGREPSAIYVAGSRDEFTRKTGLPAGMGAIFLPEGLANHDRCVVTFSDRAPFESRRRDLARETTYQTELLAWSGDRIPPAWLAEGLAVLMSEGLDFSDEGTLEFDLAHERIPALQRHLASEDAHTLETVLNATRQEYRTIPFLDSYAWSLVHYMAFTTDRLEVDGRSINLKRALATRFLDEGASDAHRESSPALDLAWTMGCRGEDSQEKALAALEKGWRRWVLGLSTPYALAPLGIEVALPALFVATPARIGNADAATLDPLHVATVFEGPAGQAFEVTVVAAPALDMRGRDGSSLDSIERETWLTLAYALHAQSRAETGSAATATDAEPTLVWFPSRRTWTKTWRVTRADGTTTIVRTFAAALGDKVILMAGDPDAVFTAMHSLRVKK